MVRLALLVALAGVGLSLAGCNTSYNYFQEEADASERKGDTTAFGAFLSMTGMVPQPKATIDHRPRAPLAVPSSSELPPPEDTSPAEAALDFPVDADERERERQRQLDELGAEAAYELSGGNDNSNMRVSAADVVAGRRAGGGLTRPENDIMQSTRPQHFRLNREQMRQTFRTQDRATALITEEGTPAPRRYLIQPPADYRTPAETAALPEPGDIENSEWAKKRLYKVEDRKPPRMLKD